MEHSEKIILDLCGGTGAWSKPYREAMHGTAYRVIVLTLPDHDVTQVTYHNRVRFSDMHEFMGMKIGDMIIPLEDVYGILAAPPCTEFSVAKGDRPRDLAGGMDVVEACLKIIWNCRIHGNLKFWALENPRGLLRQFLGVPHYTFEHWQFGGDKCKPTDIWGYFSEPTAPVKTATARGRIHPQRQFARGMLVSGGVSSVGRGLHGIPAERQAPVCRQSDHPRRLCAGVFQGE